jgi:hypothetical protein
VARTIRLSDPTKKRFVRLYNSLLAKGHSGWKVFSDFCEMAAMSLANSFSRCEAREAKYMEVVGRYSPPELDALSEMLACVVEGLDHEVDGQLREEGKPAFPACDFLGSLFMELNLSSHWRGQFFTPYHLCQFMARMAFNPEELRDKLDSENFITVMEPASGAGAMIIAFAAAMLDEGFNPQQQMHVTAIDVDQTAAYMTFIQLSLLGIPATIYVGNSLSGEMREVLHTPFHHLFLWDRKLQRRYARLALEQPPSSDLNADSLPTEPNAWEGTDLTLDLPSLDQTAAAPVQASSPKLRPRADVTLPAAVQTDLFAAAA